MTDIAHIALFNLTLETTRKYHDLDKSVLPFMETNWKYFQPTGEVNQFSLFTNCLSECKNLLPLVNDFVTQRTTNENTCCFLAIQEPVICLLFTRKGVFQISKYLIRFMCGRELKKKKTMWGLRTRLPPAFPTALTPQSQRIFQLWTKRDSLSLLASVE